MDNLFVGEVCRIREGEWAGRLIRIIGVHPEMADVYQCKGYGWSIHLGFFNKRPPEEYMVIPVGKWVLRLWPRHPWQEVTPYFQREQLEQLVRTN